VLKKEADFVRFVGERATVKLRVAMELPQPGGTDKTVRKNFLGVIRGFSSGVLSLECEGQLYEIAFSNIDKARLNPEF
jgi:ribosome maturation factor RimP